MHNRLRRFGRILVSCVIAGVCPAGLAQTITVDIADADVIDVNPDTATVADLPGPDGHISFSEAMIASNNTPGRQTVGFAIPPSEWTYLSFIYPGRAVIHGMMFYANAYAELTIDGTTQTAFTGDTNPDGWEVVILRGGGLYIPADDCVLTGLDSTVVYIEGSGATVESTSMMGVEIYGGLGGSGTLVRNNTGGGNLKIDQSNNNVVVGSTFQRVRVLGWIAGGRPATNNRIGGPDPADRNIIMGLGTQSSQGIPGGFAVQLFDAVGTLIENNRIGTTPDGLSQGHPLTPVGIFFDNENHDTIIRNNQIAGILAVARPPHAPAYYVGTAIQVYGSGDGVSIVGNSIGLNANGEPTMGSVTGIATTNYFLGPVQNVTIGGTGEGEGNEIAGHMRTGVQVANTFTGVGISGNSIHDNGALGIDLITSAFAEGVTLNDPADSDTGANGLQNFPVLASVLAAGSGVTVIGTLASAPLTSFSVEVFASASCDPSGYGEGERFLGTLKVTTDSSGAATFDEFLAAPVEPGEFVTATATRSVTRDTSEFSACVVAIGPACLADFNADGIVNSTDVSDFINAWFEDQVMGTLVADWDHNGIVNSTDVSEFINSWFEDAAAGCG